MAVGVENGIVAVDMYPMVVRGDIGVERGLLFRRSGEHVSGAPRGSGREAEDNECGSNVKSHGQNASP
jgi:hypothetical protein